MLYVTHNCFEICQLVFAAVNPLLLVTSWEMVKLQIHCLQYRIQHESIPLAEEKQLLKEIKRLEGTRETVIANAAMRAKIQDSMGQKEVIQDQVKVRNFFVLHLSKISYFLPVLIKTISALH